MNANEFLDCLKNPQAYIGGEINSCRREFSRENINVCLVFPDSYAIGMSHAGLKILYHLLNRLQGVHAERAFMPEPENIPIFKQQDMPLFSLENRIPLRDFDLIGFSLLSELNFTNVLQVLDMSGLPLLSAQRQEEDPLVAAGGIAVANPEPMRAIVDLFAFGDGEIIFPDLITVLKTARQRKTTRHEVLREFDRVAGVYVPALYPLKETGSFFVPDLGGRRIKKRVCPDLNRVPAEPAEIVPICDVVFNRLNVEIARGCPQNCRFCQAKSYYAPFRFRDPEPTLGFIQESLAATGYESFSLASLSSGDYPHLPELLRRIPAVIQPDIAFSVPSLRPSTLSEELLSVLSMFRKTGITIVPEAGSERLRRVINKNVTDAEIFQALDIAWRHGWQKIKMYFMLGLPGETMEDTEAIALLLEKILSTARERRARISIHASFSSFVPKPHTPLQWAARAPLEALEGKAAWLKSRLKRHKNLDLDFHSPGRGMIETILARGDARVGDLLLQAYRNGETFSAWDLHFHLPVWEELLRQMPAADFLSEFPLEAELPWDFIQLNFQKRYLAEEYKRSQSAESSRPCTWQDCAACAGCMFGQNKIPTPVLEGATETRIRPPAAYRRLRLHYEKNGDRRFLSHLAMMQFLERLLRKSGLLFKYSEGFHPRIKVAALPPLPVGAEGFDEIIEIHVAGDLSENKVLERLNRSQADFHFNKAEFVTTNRSLYKDLRFVGFFFAWAETKPCREDIATLLYAGDSFVFSEAGLTLKMDYAHGGQERFARIYKLLDPERRWTAHLRRTEVRFNDEN
jgi:radical SAM family uncharacterized protein